MRISKDPQIRHREILQTARHLLEKQGIAKTTMVQIASEIGVAKGLLYYYFPSKDKLVETLFNEFSEKLERDLNVIGQDTALDFFEKTQAFFFAFFNKIRENEALLSFSTEDPGMHFLLKSKLCQIAYQIMLTVIEQGAAEKQITLQHPDYMLRILIDGLAELYGSGVHDPAVHAVIVEQTLDLPAHTLRL